MNNKSEQLEDMISTYINTKFVEIPPTEDEFLTEASVIREKFKDIMPVNDHEFQSILNRLKQMFEIQMDVGIYIVDHNNGHQSWLPARRADMDFIFWDRYRKYLEAMKHWNPRVTSKLGTVSDEILDLCGDPEEECFAIKGLVMGDVQSGKTANYTAICNKAADAGYRIIIILAGMQENLRRQTQGRLDEECIGRNSKDYLDPKLEQGIKNRPVGVGKYGNKKFATFTSVTNDFDRGILRNNNLGIENINCPVVLVVKKNKRILNNLIQWLADNNTQNSSGQIELPMMLIDDEADNASINTKDLDSEPSTINDCIRRLLMLFNKTTYLGITATPFANIFIDSKVEDDLFPGDFIYTLSAPDNYIGPDRIFGENGDYVNIVETIDLTELEEYFPTKHKKDLIVDDLPTDLYEAAYYFLLANAVRDFRGDTTEHRSMMVHISLYTNVQIQIAEILNNWLDQVKSDLRNYSKLPLEQTEKIKSITTLHNIWGKYNLSDISGASWTEILHSYLYRAVAPIDVRAVNMRTGASSLDYSMHEKDGLRVIAVGGNSLSRGLTLEGLCVAYFHRNTKMYDTLLQMGRWFGYRSNYDDLIKIWMSQEAIDWYGQITRATVELKEEISVMRHANQTPREFGLKVRQDPGTLIVTAANKMRSGIPLKCPVSVSHKLLETPRLKASRPILTENEKLFKSFIDSLAVKGERLEDLERTKGHYFWEHVTSEAVADLVYNFDTHPWHLSFNGKALAEYINKHQWPDGWDVVLINSGDGKELIGGIKCGHEILDIMATEKRSILADDKMISVSKTKLRVGSGGCTKIGLTNQQIKDAEYVFKQTHDKKNVSDSAYLIENRAPILMLHIIQADYSESPNKDLPLFLYALGVGFPDSPNRTETANYIINTVEARNWMDIPDDIDEGEMN